MITANTTQLNMCVIKNGRISPSQNGHSVALQLEVSTAVLHVFSVIMCSIWSHPCLKVYDLYLCGLLVRVYIVIVSCSH